MCSIKLPVGVIAKILIELENSASGEEMFKRKGVVTLLLGPWCRNPNPRVDWVSSTSDSRMMLSSCSNYKNSTIKRTYLGFNLSGSSTILEKCLML